MGLGKTSNQFSRIEKFHMFLIYLEKDYHEMFTRKIARMQNKTRKNSHNYFTPKLLKTSIIERYFYVYILSCEGVRFG